MGVAGFLGFLFHFYLLLFQRHGLWLFRLYNLIFFFLLLEDDWQLSSFFFSLRLGGLRDLSLFFFLGYFFTFLFGASSGFFFGRRIGFIFFL